MSTRNKSSNDYEKTRKNRSRSRSRDRERDQEYTRDKRSNNKREKSERFGK